MGLLNTSFAEQGKLVFLLIMGLNFLPKTPRPRVIGITSISRTFWRVGSELFDLMPARMAAPPAAAVYGLSQFHKLSCSSEKIS